MTTKTLPPSISPTPAPCRACGKPLTAVRELARALHDLLAPLPELDEAAAETYYATPLRIAGARGDGFCSPSCRELHLVRVQTRARRR